MRLLLLLVHEIGNPKNIGHMIWSRASVSNVRDFFTHNLVVSAVELGTFWENSLSWYIRSPNHSYSFLDSIISILGIYSKVGVTPK